MRVELTGTYGGDLTHALSAWTSTSRDLNEAKRGRIPALLKMLATSEPPHYSPFEKSALHFLVRVDTASHIHVLKHRIGVSTNGESARYKQIQPSFHIPDDWPASSQAALREHCQRSRELYEETLEALEPDLGRKRAKETARFFLPYASEITLDVMFNFKSFVHFLSLRHKPDAQKEINDVADAMLKLVRDQGDFEHSLAAFSL